MLQKTLVLLLKNGKIYIFQEVLIRDSITASSLSVGNGGISMTNSGILVVKDGDVDPDITVPSIEGVDNNNTEGVGVRGYSFVGTGIIGESYSGTGVVGKTSGSYGVYGSSIYGFGVYGESQATIGVFGESINSEGVFGRSENEIGISGLSFNGIGGDFYAHNNIGLRASTGDTIGSWAGYFYGNVFTSGMYSASDKNLKKNIREFGNAMSIINKLKPKNYEFRNDGKYAALNLPKGYHYGLIAQELEEVLPNLVKESPHELTTNRSKDIRQAAGKLATTVAEQKEVKESINIKAVNYTELIPIMIKAMQEQDAKIEVLTQLVNKLTQNSTSAASVKLSTASLDQNTPNPTNKNNTQIGYYVPAGSGRAELIIKDSDGKKVKQIQLNNNGQGVINIETSTLGTGAYFYTLMIDGKLIETKKMIVDR